MSEGTLFSNGAGPAQAEGAVPADTNGNGTAQANGSPPPDPTDEGDRTTVRELVDGQDFEAVLASRERELRRKRDGSEYLKLELADSTGKLTALDWDATPEFFEAAAPGSVVVVSGRFSEHAQYGKQVKIVTLRRAAEGEYDPGALAQAPAASLERLEADLRALIETIQNPALGELLQRFFGEGTAAWERFREAPAAKYYHQAYAGGLLEHTLSVAQAVSASAAFFGGINRDVAVTGALLHDLGKTEAYNDDPLAIDLTDAGRLQAEIPLGYYKVRREIEEIAGFDPDLAQAILHIVLSHHGALEHGSPVVPCTREATLVHAADNLGGKLGSFDRLERELADGSSWSGFDRGLHAAAFFGSQAA